MRRTVLAIAQQCLFKGFMNHYFTEWKGKMLLISTISKVQFFKTTDKNCYNFDCH